MRSFILFIFSFLSLSVFGQSNVSVTFQVPDVMGTTGQVVCLPVTAIDFTGGIEFSFALRTEVGGALTFNRVQNLNPAIGGFDMDDFNLVDFLFEGVITVNWRSFADGESCLNAPFVVTLPDDAVLFEVCYDVSGALTTNHPVEIYDKPDSVPGDGIDDFLPVAFNKRSTCNSSLFAIPGRKNGSVTIGVEPLILEVNGQTGNFQPGDIYCVDVDVVSGFTDLTSFQFGIAWDSNVLSPREDYTTNTELRFNSPGGYNIIDDESFYATWSPLGGTVESLDDGSNLLTLCFDVVGECRDRTTISIEELPVPGAPNRPITASGVGSDLENIPIIPTGRDFAIDNCNPDGFDVIINCLDDNPTFGDRNVCIEVQAGDNFVDMSKMDYTISWNPSLLSFTNVGSSNSSLVINAADDYITDQTDQGLFFFDWDTRFPAGNSLDPGEVVFTLCFDVVGFGGTSAITVSDFRNDIVSNSNGVFNGVDPTNCAITIDRPGGVAVRFPDVGLRSTEDRCFPIEVDGFEQVASFTLNVQTSPSILIYADFIPAISGITATQISPGVIELSYSGPVLNLPNGTSLGDICYRARASAETGTCDSIRLTQTFLPSEVITTESAGLSVDITDFPGETCVLFPNGFGLNVIDTQTFLDSAFCVPVNVYRFVDVETAQLLFRFDAARAIFEGIDITGTNWPGLTQADFDVTRADVGIITLNFNAGGPGVSFAGGDDETEAFQFCFRARNQPGCFDLTAEPDNDPPTQTGEGNGSIIINNGEVCIQDRIILTSITALPTTCNDGMDGQILYETAPRPGNEPIFIRTTNPVLIGRNGQVSGLPPGMQVFTLYTPGGEVQTIDSIFIPFDPATAAVADAGPDVFFSCNGTQATLLRSFNNVGETYRLLFLNEDVTRFVQSGEIRANGSASIIVNEVGQYILEVANEFGCSDQDTVEVSPGAIPIADAGPQLQIDCVNDSVRINGGGSSAGPTVTYLWERVTSQGTPIDTIDDRLRTVSFFTDVPGRYRLTVTFADLQCSSQDSVDVFDEVNIPSSTLPARAELDCDGTAVELTVGPFNTDYLYSWTELEEGFPVSSNNTYFADREGQYVVEIRDTTNACVRFDTVLVVASSGAPSIVPPEFLTANCGEIPTLIEPLYQNTGESTRYIWSTDNGSFNPLDVNEPTLRAFEAGTYQVVVSNGTCSDTTDILVGDPILPFPVEAGPDVAIGCDVPAQLEGMAESPLGQELSFQWTRDGFEVPMGNARTVSVDQPGLYLFTATITSTGCSASDSVRISEPDGFPEYELADTIRGLGCEPDMVDISVEADDNNYTYRWTNPSGTEISAGQTAVATVAGFYSVTITNPATGCEATDQVFVDDDAAARPVISLTQNGSTLGCLTANIRIDASATEAGGSFTFSWEAIDGGEDVSDETSSILTVTTPGTYRLTVTNPATNCTSTQDVIITEESDRPNVVANEGAGLDCGAASATASITILDQPNDYTIRWASPFGNDLPMDTTAIEVTRGGTYSATVTNLETSCVTTVSVRVPDLQDSLAMIVIAEPDSFDCNNPVVTLDASGTTLSNDAGETISWASLNGNEVTPPTGSLIVTVSGAGDYVLTIDNGNGCAAMDTVNVAAAADTPFADAGADIQISCEEMPQLDGSASSPAPGGSIVYEWTVIGGSGEILSGAGEAMPFVSGTGIYQLVVTNTVNGCADSSSVNVRINDMERATLPADFSVCGDTAMVTGNLPEGTTGVYTSFDDDGAVFTVEGTTAVVSNLANGISLVWTLSQDGCENYSADTIRITPEAVPLANDDELLLSGRDNVNTIDLLANDVTTGPVTVTLLTDPAFGEVVSNIDGTLTFRAPVGLTEQTTIDYEVCSTTCPDRCAVATLTIISSADGEDPQVYNAITPNGDGTNDVFVFELLEQRGADFPNREFIVFNRWGDVVFETKPYNNDWGGTSNSGDPLPEATYYYILRLNIGEGDIIRGDVTIIR